MLPRPLVFLLLASPAVPGVAAEFVRAVRILEERCGECHTGNSRKGGLSMNTRESLLAGAKDGPVVVPGAAAKSRLLDLVVSKDEDERMPPRKGGGDPLTAEEVGILRAWVDAGLPWDGGHVFEKNKRAGTAVRTVELPADAELTHPLDRLLAPYFKARGIAPPAIVDDRVFARRVHLDLTGLIPEPGKLTAFLRDPSPDKRARLVRALLADKIAYADHWLTFWNDLLRNNYYGTGFIDNGRAQITGWLYEALLRNKPYDQFARELIGAAPGAEGYLKGIVWRGVVNASQRPVMQAAQNISQVFLGTNLKCASCHDSFIDSWTLEESYAFANCFSEDGRLELVRCDKPLGKMAAMRLPFPELGRMDAGAPLAERRARAAEALTSPRNGLFARAMVNRLWRVFFGFGLVEPVDMMANRAWHPDLLDWLANDLVAHGYDLKRTMEIICTSRAYQMKAVANPRPEEVKSREFRYVFRGPYVRRLGAEQLFDAMSAVLRVPARPQGADTRTDGRGQGGQLLAIRKAQERLLEEDAEMKGLHPAAPVGAHLRASGQRDHEFLSVLGRPNREQVVTTRDTLATTLQALELSNGRTLDQLLKSGATVWLRGDRGRDAILRGVFRSALGRGPNARERAVCLELLGEKPGAEQVADFLWSVLMLPEFQMVY